MLKNPLSGIKKISYLYSFKNLNIKLFKLKHLLIIIILLPFLSCCNRNKIPSEGMVEAKIIEYRVEYLDEKAGGIPTSILPGKMILIFADHYAVNRIDGFLGQFSLTYIANLKTRRVISLIKIFDKKYYYSGDSGEIPSGIDPMNNLKVEKTGNKKEISGYSSDELRIISPDGIEFMVYTTSFENIRNPNITTPYNDIADVLLEFYTSLSDMRMKLSASRIYSKEVEWNTFHVPEDYKEITKDAMEKTIRELFR